MKRLALILALVFVVAVAMQAMAKKPTDESGNYKGNQAPSGSHYNLNIIGVPHSKAGSDDMVGTKRHTIFVPLNTTEGANAKIYLIPTTSANMEKGQYFTVCDGNGFDQAYDCAGNQVTGAGNGATFMLPCNSIYELSQSIMCDEEDAQLAYEVWVRELGTPSGGGYLKLCGPYETEPGNYCNTGDNIVTLLRKNPPKFVNVTHKLTVLYSTAGPKALFAGDNEGWYWDYDNNGLKLAQLRFYPMDPYPAP